MNVSIYLSYRSVFLHFLLLFLACENYAIDLLCMHFRVNFDLDRGIVGQNADFKESQKKLEWSVKKANLIPLLAIE